MVKIANKTEVAVAANDDTHVDWPSTIGKYRPQRILGSGASGRVYLAQDTVLERVVALKVLESHDTRQRDDRERFLQEARAVAKLSHPQIVAIHEIDQHEGRPYIAMEWMQGGSVQQALDERGAISWPQATAWMQDACAAVAAVHAAGMLHRDIKPGNLLLTEHGRVKLADFGLVKLTTGAHLVTTLSHGPKGTPSFMSPEQCRAEPLDTASDIYSLGATYYALLTGHAPYSAETPLAVMFAHCSSPPPDLQATHPELPAECADIVRRAMAKDPDQRYATVEELAAALTAVAGGSGLPADRSRRAPAHRRRKRFMASALLSAAVVVGLMARQHFSYRGATADRAPAAQVASLATTTSGAASNDAAASTIAASRAESNEPSIPVLPQLVLLGDHRGQVSDMDLMSDGKRVVSIGAAGAIGVWNPAKPGTYTHRFAEADPPPHRLFAQGYFPKHELLLTGGAGPELTLWDLNTGAVVLRAPHVHGVVRSIDVSADGKSFVTGGDLGWNHWSLRGKDKMVDRGSITDGLVLVHTVRYSQVQSLIAATSGNGIVSIHSLVSPDRSVQQTKDDQVLAFAFGHARCEFAFVTRRGRIQLGSSSPRVEHTTKLAAPSMMPLVLEFAPNRRLFVAGEENGRLSFFNVETGACRQFSTGRKYGVTAVRFAPGGESLAIGDSSGAVLIAKTPEEILPPVVAKGELTLDLAANVVAQLKRAPAKTPLPPAREAPQP